MISKTDLRIMKLMIEKSKRMIAILNNHSRDEIQSDYILSDAIQFEFEKLYEDSTRLSMEIRIQYGTQLHIDDLRAIRNRVAHDYESVSLKVLLDTVQNDIPKLKDDLDAIIQSVSK